MIGRESIMSVSSSRAVCPTELSWCRAVPTGTGITVLALLFSKPPDVSLLENALRSLQSSHPILNSRLRFDPSSNSFSYVTPQSPYLQIRPFDSQSTSHILASQFQSHPPLAPHPRARAQHQLLAESQTFLRHRKFGARAPPPHLRLRQGGRRGAA